MDKVDASVWGALPLIDIMILLALWRSGARLHHVPDCLSDVWERLRRFLKKEQD